MTGGSLPIAYFFISRNDLAVNPSYMGVEKGAGEGGRYSRLIIQYKTESRSGDYQEEPYHPL
jgi:hypothetical protein